MQLAHHVLWVGGGRCGESGRASHKKKGEKKLMQNHFGCSVQCWRFSSSTVFDKPASAGKLKAISK